MLQVEFFIQKPFNNLGLFRTIFERLKSDFEMLKVNFNVL